MNKQYIKRRITLHKLGFSISEDIKEYYDYFHLLIGNINKLEELTYNDYPNSIFWKKDGKVLFKYVKVEEKVVMDYNIWKKYEEKYNLDYIDIGNILSSMFEDTFKIKVNITKVDSLTLY